MSRLLRSLPLALLALLCLGAAPLSAAPDPVIPPPLPESGEDHAMEELGVNPYTAPSIPMLLEELSLLRPIPYPAARRPIPENTPTARPLLALHFGALVADGFLVAVSERPDDADTIGRMLVKTARAMGVGQAVTRHARSLGERAARKDWAALRKELEEMQEDVETGLMDLRDEEIAHLIALGGWMRGLQIYSRIAEKEYDPAKASQLLQPELLDYFLDRLKTLSPGTREEPWVAPTLQAIRAIRESVGKPEGETLPKDEVSRIHSIISGAVEAVARAGEPTPAPAASPAP